MQRRLLAGTILLILLLPLEASAARVRRSSQYYEQRTARLYDVCEREDISNRERCRQRQEQRAQLNTRQTRPQAQQIYERLDLGNQLIRTNTRLERKTDQRRNARLTRRSLGHLQREGEQNPNIRSGRVSSIRNRRLSCNAITNVRSRTRCLDRASNTTRQSMRARQSSGKLWSR